MNTLGNRLHEMNIIVRRLALSTALLPAPRMLEATDMRLGWRAEDRCWDELYNRLQTRLRASVRVRVQVGVKNLIIGEMHASAYKDARLIFLQNC